MNRTRTLLLAACAAFLLTSCAKDAESPAGAAASGSAAERQALGDAAGGASPGAAGAGAATVDRGESATAGADGAGAGNTPGDSGALTEAGGPPAPVVAAPRMRTPAQAEHTLATVYFPFDGYKLSDAARQALSRTAEWLRAHPQAVVRVAGHADERGTSEYNLGLGQRRAESVRSFLVASGIADKSLRPVSMGEEVPAREGHTEAAWAANRRVEFTILDDTVARR